MAIFYIDSINGDDANDGKSRQNPLKTLSAVYQYIDLADETTIYLNDGEYILNSLDIFNVTGTLNIIGKSQNTTIRKTFSIPWVNGGNGKTGNLNIYNLIWQEESVNVNEMSTNTNITFHNVLINNKDKLASYGNFSPMKNGITFYNCVFIGFPSAMQTDNGGSVKLYNCYGNVVKGEYTTPYDIENNVFTDTPLLDDKYNIIDESVDISTVGLYAGTYGWQKILIKKNNKYYTINSEKYNPTLNMFDELSNFSIDNFDDYSFSIDDLFTEVTIGDETFKPIDKFDNFQIVSKDNFDCIITGLKSTQEMIATLEPLNMRAYDVIHNITGDYVIENNGVIKLLFSFDKGTTWKTYDVNNSEWNDVNVDIPIKLYENFTDEDKTNWNDATNTILSDGISVQNLGNVEFESVRTNSLMFAVAFNRPTYSDTCTLKDLKINYDGLETYIQLACGSDLNKYEATISITGDSVEVKTASNQNKILVTMTTNI